VKYVSTRGEAPSAGFREACLAGLAPDGGLYVPDAYPQITPAAPGETYAALAARILGAFAGDALSPEASARLTREAYAGFAHCSVAPLTQAGPDLWLMELHHGPTLAFKDLSLIHI
jgi:threonine synthase